MTDVVPIFPLPNAVLFPRTVLPLHVFEPRYREMIHDAVAGDGLIAIALLKPGYEAESAESPEIHAVGTVGRIENLRPLDDGRFILDLVGLQRVEFEELPSGKAYRIARVTALQDDAVDETDPRLERAKLDLLASHGLLVQEISGEGSPSLPLNDRLPLEAAVNGTCANLPVDAEVRQALLEENDPQLRLEAALQVTNEVLKKVLVAKQPSDGDTQVN